jgi:hypothetical protein
MLGQTLSDNIGRQLIFERGNAVAQNELALLQSLNLQTVGGREIAERVDRRIEVAVLLPQPFEFRPQRCALLVGQLFGHSKRYSPQLSPKFAEFGAQAKRSSVLPEIIHFVRALREGVEVRVDNLHSIRLVVSGNFPHRGRCRAGRILAVALPSHDEALTHEDKA